MLDAILLKFSPIFNIFRGGPKRVGISSKGKDAKIHDNEFENLDVSIKSEGDNLTAERNKIK